MDIKLLDFTKPVPLSEKQWDRLCELEKDWELGRVDHPLDIHKTLEALGAEKVDWSGHYGMNIFFQCDADFEKDPEFGQAYALAVSTKLEELLGKE